ncbi:unnamed protein product [Protopolystoma xenopodis]|uniref:Peptidase A2 domain-containing protein n=1 Tax=Protopolystoma xenopodis TaxID=117903 RepID=A0A448WA05_9PLAT|nr:unnamed protein product [Protopolystoma xenopodis]
MMRVVVYFLALGKTVIESAKACTVEKLVFQQVTATTCSGVTLDIRLLFVYYKRFSQKYLVDTGVEVSLIPPSQNGRR